MQAVLGWDAYGTNLTLDATNGASKILLCGVYVFTLPGMSCKKLFDLIHFIHILSMKSVRLKNEIFKIFNIHLNITYLRLY